MSESESLNPIGLLKVFFRRKELIIIPAFIGLVVGICTGMVLPKKYVSSTIMLVEEGKSDNPLFRNLAVSTTVGQRLTTIRESMLGWHSIVELIKRLGMDKDIKTAQALEAKVMGIRKQISISLRGHNIIQMAYLGDTPETTQAVVQNITDIFISRNREIQNQETDDAIIFIEEQLVLYRGKIKSAEIAKMRDDLDVLLMDSTEAHPSVKLLREHLTRKERELKEENLEYTENNALDIRSVNPIIREIQDALGNLEGYAPSASRNDPIKIQDEYYKVLLVDKLDKVMARDAGVNNRLYNMLLQRLETAKITKRLQSSKEGTRYTVLDPPRLPLKPVRPNKVLVALACLFVGLISGCGLVFALEFLDKSFIDVEDASKFFGTPLLGAISKINTEATLRQDREKKIWLYSLTFSSGIVFVMLTVALSNFVK